LYIKSELNNIKDPREDFKGTEIHNQYLSALLETGIVGLFFLIYIYFKPCFSINSKFKIVSSMPLISIAFLILIASIIEPFFSVIKGVVIFALFSSLFKISYLNNKKQFNV
jgi:O-antigen ligase